MNERYKYGNLCDKYDMTGDITFRHGTLRVHDIFGKTPAFMLEADVLFSDPPCSLGNINSFYAKADKEERQDDYAKFLRRFWEVVDEISPRVVYLEVFKSNKAKFLAECEKRFRNIRVFNSMYYRKPSNHCWIIQASNEELPDINLEGIDEEDAIEKICTETAFECIADPCMGKGLVAFYASRAGKRFAGTELSKYRLAVACERLTTGMRGTIN